MTPSINTNFSPALFLNEEPGRSWQTELERFNHNYYLLETILDLSVGLPSHLTTQYLTCQEQMRHTLEQLLTELEPTTASHRVNGPKPVGFLPRHTTVLQHMNQQVTR